MVFIVSGYFLVGHANEKGWYANAVRKRLGTIVLPFYIWLIVYKVFNYVVWKVQAELGINSGFANPFSGKDIFSVLLGLTGVMPYEGVGVVWYLRMLFFLALLSPVIVAAVVRMKWGWVVFVFALYLGYRCAMSVGMLCHDGPFDYYFSLRGLAYFSLGVAIRFGIVKARCPYWLAFVGASLLVARMISWQRGMPLLSSLCDFLMVPGLISLIWRATEGIGLPRALVNNSMALYLVHPIFIIISVGIIVTSGLRDSMYISRIVCMARIVFVTGCSLGITEMMRKCCPRPVSFMLGGR